MFSDEIEFGDKSVLEVWLCAGEEKTPEDLSKVCTVLFSGYTDFG